MLHDSFRARWVTRVPASQQQHLAGVLPPGLCRIQGLHAPPPSRAAPRRAVPEPCSGAGPKADWSPNPKAGDEKQDRKEEEKTRGWSHLLGKGYWRAAKLSASSLLPDTGVGGILQFRGRNRCPALQIFHSPQGWAQELTVPWNKAYFSIRLLKNRFWARKREKDRFWLVWSKGGKGLLMGELYLILSSLLIQLLFQA